MTSGRASARKIKLVQFWVPDVTTEAFKREAHRQSLAVSRSAAEREDQVFINSVSAIWQDDN